MKNDTLTLFIILIWSFFLYDYSEKLREQRMKFEQKIDEMNHYKSIDELDEYLEWIDLRDSSYFKTI